MAMTVGRMGGERQATGCGQRAAGKQDLSMQYFSPYYAEPLRISTLVSCGIVVVHGIVDLGIK